MTSSVIYYSTHARQNDIYLLNHIICPLMKTTRLRDAERMKGQGGQLLNKGHLFNKYIFTTYTFVRIYLYSCRAVVIAFNHLHDFSTFEAGLLHF